MCFAANSRFGESDTADIPYPHEVRQCNVVKDLAHGAYRPCLWGCGHKLAAHRALYIDPANAGAHLTALIAFFFVGMRSLQGIGRARHGFATLRSGSQRAAAWRVLQSGMSDGKQPRTWCDAAASQLASLALSQQPRAPQPKRLTGNSTWWKTGGRSAETWPPPLRRLSRSATR